MTFREKAARLRRSRYAGAAVIGTIIVAVGAIAGAILLSKPTRNAPANANYSLDANPTFYANVRTTAAANADAQSQLAAVQRQAVAGWLPTDAADAAKTITKTLGSSRANGTIPIFVVYAIPDRDLGGYSAGGLSADGYRGYLRSVSSVIGDAPAIVIVEPDALAHTPDLPADKRDGRTTLLAAALDTFHDNVKTAVYLDAGNSDWRSAADTAGLLKQVSDKSAHGIPGISLNVSNYRSSAESRAYGEAVGKAYGHDLYTMIDVSRNGARTAAGDWCNPTGARLGSADARFDAGVRVEEAFIKTPGESDGQCGTSDKPAGTFDPQLMLALAGAR